MPNLYWFWQRGVKFGSHYAASQMCTPSRSAIVTGLYTHQVRSRVWFLTDLPTVSQTHPNHSSHVLRFQPKTTRFLRVSLRCRPISRQMLNSWQTNRNCRPSITSCLCIGRERYPIPQRRMLPSLRFRLQVCPDGIRHATSPCAGLTFITGDRSVHLLVALE